MMNSVHVDKRPTQGITLQSWLEKKSKSTVTKGWHKRWYVLRGDTITYMKHSVEKGDVLLQYHTIVLPAVRKYDKVYFKIVTSNKKYRFRCDEDKIAEQWVSTCRAVVKHKSQTTIPLAADETILLEHAKKNHSDFTANHYEEHGARGPRTAKLEQVLGFEKLGVGEDKEKDKDYDQKFRANVRYIVEKYRPMMKTSIQDAAGTRGGDGVFRILSLDGGGLKGVMHSVIVERLCKQFPNLLDYVDCIAGSSGGAIIASALAAGYPPIFARQVLELGATTMFHKRAITKVGQAKYNPKWTKVTLEEISGDQKLNQLPRKLVIPTFSLDNYNQFQTDHVRAWEPKILHNFGNSERAGDTSVADAVMRSLATPSYYPSYQGHIDGSVFAHNPSMAAITLAMSPKYGARPANKVLVLSIGTGKIARHLPATEHEYDWGATQWSNKMTDLLSDASADSTQLFAQTLLGSNYHRLDPTYVKDIATDDPTLLPVLSTLANELDLTNTLTWIGSSFFPIGAEVQVKRAEPAKPAPTPIPARLGTPVHRPSFTTPLTVSVNGSISAPSSPSKPVQPLNKTDSPTLVVAKNVQAALDSPGRDNARKITPPPSQLPRYSPTGHSPLVSPTGTPPKQVFKDMPKELKLDRSDSDLEPPQQTPPSDMELGTPSTSPSAEIPDIDMTVDDEGQSTTIKIDSPPQPSTTSTTDTTTETPNTIENTHESQQQQQQQQDAVTSPSSRLISHTKAYSSTGLATSTTTTTPTKVIGSPQPSVSTSVVTKPTPPPTAARTMSSMKLTSPSVPVTSNNATARPSNSKINVVTPTSPTSSPTVPTSPTFTSNPTSPTNSGAVRATSPTNTNTTTATKPGTASNTGTLRATSPTSTTTPLSPRTSARPGMPNGPSMAEIPKKPAAITTTSKPPPSQSTASSLPPNENPTSPAAIARNWPPRPVAKTAPTNTPASPPSTTVSSVRRPQTYGAAPSPNTARKFNTVSSISSISS